jgi:hypothetical protein
VQAIQCPEHTTAGRTAPAGTRINQVSLDCLASAIERQISALITSECRDYFPHRQLETHQCLHGGQNA